MQKSLQRMNVAAVSREVVAAKITTAGLLQTGSF